MSETLMLPCPKLNWTRDLRTYNSGELCVMVACDQFALVSTRFSFMFGRRGQHGGWMFKTIGMVELDHLVEYIRRALPETWARDLEARVVEAYWTTLELLLQNLEPRRNGRVDCIRKHAIAMAEAFS